MPPTRRPAPPPADRPGTARTPHKRLDTVAAPGCSRRRARGGGRPDGHPRAGGWHGGRRRDGVRRLRTGCRAGRRLLACRRGAGCGTASARCRLGAVPAVEVVRRAWIGGVEPSVPERVSARAGGGRSRTSTARTPRPATTRRPRRSAGGRVGVGPRAGGWVPDRQAHLPRRPRGCPRACRRRHPAEREHPGVDPDHRRPRDVGPRPRAARREGGAGVGSAPAGDVGPSGAAADAVARGVRSVAPGPRPVLLPCGITLSMEVLAIASGSALSGAAIMGVFVIGTPPLFAVPGYVARRSATALGAGLACWPAQPCSSPPSCR